MQKENNYNCKYKKKEIQWYNKKRKKSFNNKFNLKLLN